MKKTIRNSLTIAAMILATTGRADESAATNNPAAGSATEVETKVAMPSGEVHRVIIEVRAGEDSGPGIPYRPDYRGPRYGERPNYRDAHHGDHEHRNPARGRIDDWYVRCSDAMRVLTVARTEARIRRLSGNYNSANETMINAIRTIAERDLSIPENMKPSPHLEMTAREAVEIINTLERAISHLRPFLRTTLTTMVVDKLDVILGMAFYELDESLKKMARRDCGNCWHDHVPDNYYEGVRKLALKFVELQIDLQKHMAADLVELKMAKAISTASTNFLDDYTGRRSYCSALTTLEGIRDAVCSYLDRPDYDSQYLVDSIREEFSRAKSWLSVSSRGC